VKNRNRLLILLVGVCALVWNSGVARAQVSAGISGRVEDASGAAVSRNKGAQRVGVSGPEPPASPPRTKRATSASCRCPWGRTR
jgi:hypothetical protein